MLVFSSAIALLAAVLLFITPVQPSDELQPVSANLSCTSDQTQCALGCCPYAHAECCADGYECCQHGQTCIPVLGICLGINNEKSISTLVSSRATPVVDLVTYCPSGTTTCGPDRCCIFPHATCCVDGIHCCRQGYRCDLPNKRCVKSSGEEYLTPNLISSTSMRSFEQIKSVGKDPYKSCPGGSRQCPSYMSCCLNDEGGWGCCPNPAVSQYKKGGANMCCETIHGYICCPPWSHACTYIGCM